MFFLQLVISLRDLSYSEVICRGSGGRFGELLDSWNVVVGVWFWSATAINTFLSMTGIHDLAPFPPGFLDLSVKVRIPSIWNWIYILVDTCCCAVEVPAGSTINEFLVEDLNSQRFWN